MRIHVPLIGGTLKIKTYRELRQRERDHVVPVWRLGNIYFTWWRKGLH